MWSRCTKSAAPLFYPTKIQRSAKKQEARRDSRHDAPVQAILGGAAMFGDTELPLALIMEEILGWEKKPGEKDEEETENTQLSTTSNKS